MLTIVIWTNIWYHECLNELEMAKLIRIVISTMGIDDDHISWKVQWGLLAQLAILWKAL